MRDAIYAFMELPVGGRAAIIFGIILLLYLIFARLILRILSLIPFLISKLVYGLYVLLNIPVDALHRAFGGLFGGIDQGLAAGAEGIVSASDKVYTALHKPKKIYGGWAFLIYVILGAYFLLPLVTGLHGSLFSFWQESYFVKERGLIDFILAHL
jgi:hypothetical protein